jgi:hypothetical protein
MDDEDLASIGIATLAGTGRVPPRRERVDALLQVRERVTLVVPCCNEEHSLPYLANTLRSVRDALSRNYEIDVIFVDDHSSDRTWQVLDELFAGTRRGANPPRDESRSRSQHPDRPSTCRHRDRVLDRLRLLVRSPRSREHDPVVARRCGTGDGVAVSPRRPRAQRAGVASDAIKSLSRIYRIVLRQPLHTYTSCFRVYRRSAMIGTQPERGGFLGIAELIGKLALSGAEIVEHPATLEVRARALEDEDPADDRGAPRTHHVIGLAARGATRPCGSSG